MIDKFFNCLNFVKSQYNILFIYSCLNFLNEQFLEKEKKKLNMLLKSIECISKVRTLRFYVVHEPSCDGKQVEIEAVANRISQHPLSEVNMLKVR